MRPYLEIITRQGNLSREFSKNTREGPPASIRVCSPASTSHPSLIREALALLPQERLPSRMDSSSAVIRIVPPFMGWGWGVILESVICCMWQD